MWGTLPSVCSLLVCSLLASIACTPAVSQHLQHKGRNSAPARARTGRHLLVDQAGNTDLDAATQCMLQRGALHTRYVESCEALDAGDVTAGPRDAVTGLLRACLGATNVNATAGGGLPIRILCSRGTYSSLIANITDTYSRVTGIPVRVDAPLQSVSSQIRLNSMAHADNLSATHEAWVVSLTSFGEGVASGVLKDLTNLCQLDSRFQFEGFLRNVRTAGITYKSRVVSLPLSAYTYHLAYRRDIFQQYNLSADWRTWDEFLDWTIKYNGTAGLNSFCGLFGQCFMIGSVLMRYIMAAYTQTRGPSQGWLFEPDSMQLLLNSTAMAETMRIIKGLYDISPPDNSLQLGCPLLGYRFAGGQCLTTIMHPWTFKYASHISHKSADTAFLYGNMGIATWPGTDKVLDVPTNTLVPCTEERCPFASWDTRNGTRLLVNRSPGFEAQTFGINGKLPDDRAFYAFSTLAYVASPQGSDSIILNPDSEMMPVRTSQLQAQRWIDLGWEPHDATAWTQDTLYALEHPNMNNAARMAGSTNITFLQFVQACSKLYGGMPIPDVLNSLQASAWATLNAYFKNNMTALKQEYWASMNRDPTAPPSPSPPPLGPALQDSGSSSSHVSLIIILVVVLPTCTLLAAGLLVWYRKASRSGAASRGHPGPGPLTTLLVTDIENSTLLWEELEPAVMDASVKLHNACLRTLAAQHGGYESVWEGDSFIIAFASPQQALAFAVAAQTALLGLAWPEGLLSCDLAKEVWLKPTSKSAGSKKPKADMSLGLADLTPSTSSITLAVASRPRSGFLGLQASNSTPGQSASQQAVSSEQQVLGAANASASSAAVPTSTSGTSAAHDTRMEEQGNPLFIRGASSIADGDVAAGNSSPRALDSPLRSGRLGLAETMGTRLRALWALCEANTPGAVMAYRGLRVRMGMHAGVASAAHISFNTAMRRYHYTGPVRVVSNAVASAGHGGHILLSSSTAALLDMDSSGRLQALPADCQLFHMGCHTLSNVEDATDLLLVLPSALGCRVAWPQQPLRTLHCVLPGVWDTPLAPAITLVGITVSSLDSLLAECSAGEADKALRCVLGCLSDCTAQMGGVLVEDGLSLVLTTRKARATKAGTFPDAVTAGRVVVAFVDAVDALRFALALRHQLLHLDWSEQLLAHALWERVGGPAMPATAQLGTQRSELEPPTAGDAADSTLFQPLSAAAAAAAAADVVVRAASMPGMAATEPSVASQDKEDPAGLPPPETYRIKSGLSVVSDDTGASEVSKRFKRALGLKGAPSGVTTSLSGAPSGTLSGSHAVPRADRKEAKSLAASSGAGMCVVESPFLRGLRTRMVVLTGRFDAEIATRSSGRVVYAGRAVKDMDKLLRRAKAGQVLASAQLIQAVVRASPQPGQAQLEAA